MRNAVTPSASSPSSADRGGESRDLLVVTGLAKAFGSTQALIECSFSVRAGEIHTVVGENGSGKSTLVKVLAGIHRLDEGEIAFGGRALPRARSPRAALEGGIVTVLQEISLVGSQSVLENVWLGTDGLFVRRRSDAEKRRHAQEVLTELLGEALPLDVKTEQLPLSVRQACGIARALVRDPQILILDESTSALDIATRDRLFEIIRGRARRGGAVIFISHRMDEIEAVADRITVLRSGRSVATLDRGEISPAELIGLMSGGEHLTGPLAEQDARRPAASSATVLAARQVAVGPETDPIDFTLQAGEIVGLAGLDGHGHDEFLRLLGQGADRGEVVRMGDGGPTAITSARQARDLGMVYVPRDRYSESLFPLLSISDNFAAASVDGDRRGPLLDDKRTRRRLDTYRQKLAIKLGSPRLPITTLSGGNQQKIVLARWLALEPRVLLLNDPTRGIDLNAKRDIYRLLRQLTAEGVAVVMLSTELDELTELMDRVLVFREGSVFAELDQERLSRARLVGGFFGRSSDAG